MKTKHTTWTASLLPAVLLGVVLFLSLEKYLFIPFNDSEGVFVYVGREMARGAQLYTDVWDHKPPLLFVPFFLFQKITLLDEPRLRVCVLLVHFLNGLLLWRFSRKLGLNAVGAWD